MQPRSIVLVLRAAAGACMKTPHLIVGIDHMYLSVSDIARSESYYDRVFGALGFRKGNRAIAGERHAHYFGPRLQVSLRPARGNRPHDPYAPGLHHLCMQVATHADVDRVFSTLDGLGVAPTPPRLLPETGPDYYATFFQDPDGIRLEVVARTAGRAAMVQRWEDFEVFLNPLADLAGKRDGIFHIAAASDWSAAEARCSARVTSIVRRARRSCPAPTRISAADATSCCCRSIRPSFARSFVTNRQRR